MKQKKFRFWNGKEMVYVRWGRFVSDEEKIYYFDCIINAPEGIEVMQDTGLRDKFGHSIYEGDIVISLETDEVYRIDEMLPAHRHDHSTNIGYYSDKKYHTRDSVASRYTGDDWMSWPEMYEIIGNIYKNSDLVV